MKSVLCEVEAQNYLVMIRRISGGLKIFFTMFGLASISAKASYIKTLTCVSEKSTELMMVEVRVTEEDCKIEKKRSDKA